jgi:hypothetical protein
VQRRKEGRNNAETRRRRGAESRTEIGRERSTARGWMSGPGHKYLASEFDFFVFPLRLCAFALIPSRSPLRLGVDSGALNRIPTRPGIKSSVIGHGRICPLRGSSYPSFRDVAFLAPQFSGVFSIVPPGRPRLPFPPFTIVTGPAQPRQRTLLDPHLRPHPRGTSPRATWCPSASQLAAIRLSVHAVWRLSAS